MKRWIGFSLCLCLLLTCLTGCSGRYQENVWYSQQRLGECLVPELPAPKNRSYVNDRDADIYCFMNSSEFSGYVETIYDYLQSKNFAYFGTRGAMVNTLAGAFTTYEFQPAGESLEDFFCRWCLPLRLFRWQCGCRWCDDFLYSADYPL